jgi:hypothetical protein
MRIKIALGVFAMVALCGIATADMDPYVDYEVSDAVWSITTVRVDSNMGDAYLEGIKSTWAAGNEVSLKLGQIESYSIFRSDLPDSGDFNLLLVVKFANTSDLGPNKARYEAFMAEWGKDRADESTQFAQKNYPGMRTITGEYLMREITLK